MTKRHFLIGLITIILAAAWLTGPALAEEKKDKPPRGMVAAMVYPGITVGPEDKVRVDLKVINTGRSNETILLEVTEKPEGWKAQIKGYGKVISGVFVAEDDDKTLTFSAEPEGKDEKLKPGQYNFVVKAQTPDRVLTQTTSLQVTVVEKEKVDEAIKLTTSYPVLRGPSDAKFEFSLDVNNDSDKDSLFNLSATAPEGWEVSFKPAYEQKQISSLQIKANQSKSDGVQVTPPRKAEAGQYPIKVRVRSSAASSEVELKVVLTGTYKIKSGTPSGLLSVTTQTGKEANVSFYVRNEGSALQKEISFVSFKPENWKVEFKPEKLENLKAGELRQVEMTITPADQALVGDYSVAVSARGEKASSDMELRVTVKASSTWGWIGVAVILAVIVGLAVTFRRLGRR
ncbi:MAG: hypothetical protein JRJ59_09760 [Deltaproteobacteria bacterium]|nr:hypothetical protein [Deltaproteobacteria bacterium]